jgi:hypothetical protein
MIKSLAKGIYVKLLHPVAVKIARDVSQRFYDLNCEALWVQIKNSQLQNPKLNVMGAGYKIFSQSDEDGIIQEIFNRITTSNKIFLEVGVGNGCENNTVWLLVSGWKGIWIEADSNNYLQCVEFRKKLDEKDTVDSLRIFQKEVTTSGDFTYALDSLLELGMKKNEIDLLSIDIDSQDISICEMILKFVKPRVIAIEYNAKFPPPISISVSKSMTKWTSDDYYGASLAYIVDKLDDYLLVGTSITGSNAFFVRKEFKNFFKDVGNVFELYSPARFYLSRCKTTPTVAPLKWIFNEKK